MKDLFIGLDFDGTCVTHCFPDIGEELPNCISTLKKMQDQGAKIILNTMRSDGDERKYLQEAVSWLSERGVDLHAANNNPSQAEWTTNPKVYAHIYIDDAAIGTPLRHHGECLRPAVDWEAIEGMLFGTEHFKEAISK